MARLLKKGSNTHLGKWILIEMIKNQSDGAASQKGLWIPILENYEFLLKKEGGGTNGTESFQYNINMNHQVSGSKIM